MPRYPFIIPDITPVICQSKTPTVQQAIKELIMMGKRHPLAARELERAKVLMIFLKTQGYTNRRISFSVRGTWSESTIKLYTRGAAKLKSKHKHVSNTLLLAIGHRITLEDVENSLSLKAKLKSHHVSLDDVIAVLDEAEKYGMDIANVLIRYHNLGVSGLTTDKIQRILDLEREMKDSNLLIGDLEEILTVCTICGGKNKFLSMLRSLRAGSP